MIIAGIDLTPIANNEITKPPKIRPTVNSSGVISRRKRIFSVVITAD
jgi:hypothetical protein